MFYFKRNEIFWLILAVSFSSLVRLGEHDTSREDEAEPVEVNVVKVAKYPKYDSKDGNGDLAVLYLERDVELTSKSSSKFPND